jgi:hypothetical protein
METDGWTPGSLATELNRRRGRRSPENRQTIHHLTVKGTGCRSSRRNAIAATLGIPEPWLAGEDWPLPVGTFYEAPHRLSDLSIPINAYQMIHLLGTRSSRMALRLSRFADRCTRAVGRDLARFRPIEPVPGFLGFSPEYAAGSAAVMTLLGLALPEQWRMDLMGRPLQSPSLQPPGTQDLPIDPGEELAAQALTTALEYMVEPWLEGRVQLAYGRLADLLTALGRNPRHWLAAAPRPDVVRELDGTPHDPGDPLIPFALIGWQKAPGLVWDVGPETCARADAVLSEG